MTDHGLVPCASSVRRLSWWATRSPRAPAPPLEVKVMPTSAKAHFPGASPVRLASVGDLHDEDEEDLVVDLEEDPVGTDSDPPEVRLVFELAHTVRPGLERERVEVRLDLRAGVAGEPLQVTLGPRSQLDAVRHELLRATSAPAPP